MNFESIQGDMQKLSQMMEQPQQLELLRTSVSLVEQEKPLQTSAVIRQIRTAGALASDVRACPDLKPSSKNNGKVRDILNQLDETQNDLMHVIKAALVGVQGNTQEGFHVNFTELQRTNQVVNRALGTDLDLWSGLKRRQLEQRDGIITIDSSDAEALGFGYPQITAHGASDRTETSIYANITENQARIMTGDIGIEEWQKVAARKTTIAHNEFGKDARIMTGNQGKAGAAEFNANFWK